MPLTQALYGKKAAALYQQAGAFQAEARTFQLKAKDAYFQASNRVAKCNSCRCKL